MTGSLFTSQMAHSFNSGGLSSSPPSKINNFNSGTLTAVQMNTEGHFWKVNTSYAYMFQLELNDFD